MYTFSHFVAHIPLFLASFDELLVDRRAHLCVLHLAVAVQCVSWRARAIARASLGHGRGRGKILFCNFSALFFVVVMLSVSRQAGLAECHGKIYLDAAEGDSLVVTARGLGVERILLNLMRPHCIPASLVVVINASAEQQEYFCRFLANEKVMIHIECSQRLISCS